MTDNTTYDRASGFVELHRIAAEILGVDHSLSRIEQIMSATVGADKSLRCALANQITEMLPVSTQRFAQWRSEGGCGEDTVIKARGVLEAHKQK